MKKTLLFIIILMFACAENCYAMSAKSYVLIDAANGRVLAAQNENEKLPMASTTKIMTALVAMENSNPDDTVTVSKNAAATEGSSIYLKAGEKVSMRELLYGLLLASGNDAAVAVAEHVSGSTEEFAKKMTDKAREIGASDTSFKNPSGLDDEGHFTTAKDLAQITRFALNNPLFAEIVRTKSVTLSRSTYTNHNKLLSMYEGVTGVKTGFTKKCGRCLVSSCSRNGLRLIAVTLNDPDDWNDHISLYDKAFSEYHSVNVISDGQRAGEFKSSDGDILNPIYKGNVSAYLSDSEQARISVTKNVPDTLSLPIKQGDKIGDAVVFLDGFELGRCDIVSSETIEPKKNSFSASLFNTLCLWLSTY